MLSIIRLITAFAILFLSFSDSNAGKFNKKLSVGDKAPAWEKLEGVDGKKHGLADLKNKDVVVVVFTCNSCPVASDYEDRIIALAKEFAASAEVVAINVNTIAADQMPAMKKRSEKKKFPFAYLYDPTQEIGKAYGANFTPEFFVLDNERKVIYMGALDDKSPPAEATKKYVEAAIRAASAGKPAETGETSASSGCKIRFNAPKRED